MHNLDITLEKERSLHIIKDANKLKYTKLQILKDIEIQNPMNFRDHLLMKISTDHRDL